MSIKYFHQLQMIILISQGTELWNLLLTVCRLSCRKIEVDDPIALFFFLCNIFFIRNHFS